MYQIHELSRWSVGIDPAISMARRLKCAVLMVTTVACLSSTTALAQTEPNNDLASAHDTGLTDVGAVTISGDAVDAGLNGARSFDIDLFKFTIATASAAAPVLVTAEALSNGSPLDAYVRLFDGGGVAIAGDDDIDKDNLDARLRTFVLSPGSYYVGVSSSSNSTYSFISPPGAGGITENTTIGNFELTITVEAEPAIDSSLEPNDLSSSAVPVVGPSFLAAGQFIGDGANGRRDVDQYRISISEPTIVEAVAATDADSTLDPALSMGAIGVNDDADPTTHDARLRVALFDPGDYTLTVLGAGRVAHPSGVGTPSPGSVGFYDLTVNLTPFALGGGMDEPNDSILEATQIGDLSSGQVIVAGFLGDGRFANTRGDADVYEVSGAIDDIVTIDVNASGSPVTLDPAVTVLNYFGEELAHDDNSGGGLDSRVTVSIPDPILQVAPVIYVVVRGAGQAPPQDPFTPDPADPLPHASEHLVVDGPRSTGDYNITFLSGPPAPQPAIAPGDLVGPSGTLVPEDRIDIPVAFPSERGRIVATAIGGAEDGVMQFDPGDGTELTAFVGPEGIVGPHSGLTITSENELYVLGAGRYPRLYRLGPYAGHIYESLTLWMGSGYYGDIAELNGLLYVTDLLDQSIHAFDPDSYQATAEFRIADLGIPRLKLSGPIGALPHPDRLILSDFAALDAVVYAIDPTSGGIDETLASIQPCPCSGDYNDDGLVDGSDGVFEQNNVPLNDLRRDHDCNGIIESTDQDIFDCQLVSGIPSDPNCCPAMLPPSGVESILSMSCPCSGDFDFDGDVGADDATEFAACVFDASFLSGQIRTGCTFADMNCDGLINADDETIFNCRQAGDGVPPIDDCCTTGLPDVSVEAFALAGRRNDQILVSDGETPFIKVYDRSGALIKTLDVSSPLGTLGAEAFFDFADVNEDGTVNLVDFAAMADCLASPTAGVATGCWIFDAQPDNHVDLRDFAKFQETTSE